ncbi:MAG TPA: glycerol-3-phosphate acyltransferase [Symbiobacteriaceae bacterium]|nr:glycerol-3-phosphate acyltransferase [Symbiobacteriaceae bacterium]
MLQWVLAAAIGYLLGAIPVGFLVGQARGVDIRKFGSGATGGTNVLRTLGAGPAIFTGLCDVGKGLLGAYIGHRLAGEAGYAVGGFMAALGHSYSIWLKFRGGKSVATGAGALALQYPLGLLISIVAALGAIVPTRWVSLGSLVGGMVYLIFVLVTGVHQAHKLMAVGLIAVVYIRHWENMKRIASGTENRIGQKARPRVE